MANIDDNNKRNEEAKSENAIPNNSVNEKIELKIDNDLGSILQNNKSDTETSNTIENKKENIETKNKKKIFNGNIKRGKRIEWGNYFLCIATVGIVIATFYLYKENEKLRTTINYRTNADFYQNLRSKYFTPEFTSLFALIDLNQIIFISDPSNENCLDNIINNYPQDFPNGFPKGFSKKFPKGFPIFWIRQKYVGILINPSKKQYYTSYEIDNILMDVMDDLGLYYQTNIISEISYIQTGFGYYVQAIWESKPMKQYVIWLRENYYDETAHMHAFESLYWSVRKKFMINKTNHNIPNDYYYDSTVIDNLFLCDSGKTFIWCRPRVPKYQHED